MNLTTIKSANGKTGPLGERAVAKLDKKKGAEEGHRCREGSGHFNIGIGLGRPCGDRFGH